jgi:hypothetical protein
MNKGFLDPSLRGVVEELIVGRCRMLRYTLSLTCRDLWYRLRDERFLAFARIVSGHEALDDSEWRGVPGFVEECLRFIWPGLPSDWNMVYGFKRPSTRWLPLEDGREASFDSRVCIQFMSTLPMGFARLGFHHPGSPCSCGRCRMKRTVYTWELGYSTDGYWILSLRYYEYRGEKKK